MGGFEIDGEDLALIFGVSCRHIDNALVLQENLGKCA